MFLATKERVGYMDDSREIAGGKNNGRGDKTPVLYTEG